MEMLNKIFGTHSERELKRIKSRVDKIEAMQESMRKLSQEEMQAKTNEFKSRLEKGETVDDIMEEAYALVREAAFRVLGQTAFRTQLMGAVVLHQGRISEMKTGEGRNNFV